jgi:hypothetical protein
MVQDLTIRARRGRDVIRYTIEFDEHLTSIFFVVALVLRTRGEGGREGRSGGSCAVFEKENE